jgi:hypothetical protein
MVTGLGAGVWLAEKGSAEAARAVSAHNNALRGVYVQDDDVGMLGAAADEKRRLFVFLTVLAVLSFTCWSGRTRFFHQFPTRAEGCAFMMSSATSVLSRSWPSMCFLDKHDENKENQLDWANAVSSSDDEITARTDEDVNGLCHDEPNETATTTTTTTRAATRKGLRKKRTREDPACLSVSCQYRIRKVPVSQERVLKQHKTRRSPLYRVVPLVADGFIMGL